MARAAVSRTGKARPGHIKNARASEGGLEAVLLYRYYKAEWRLESGE